MESSLQWDKGKGVFLTVAGDGTHGIFFKQVSVWFSTDSAMMARAANAAAAGIAGGGWVGISGELQKLAVS